MVSNKQTRPNMSSIVCNCSRAVWTYILHLDSCDIIDNSDISDSSDRSNSIQEQTSLPDFAIVYIGNRQYLGFLGHGSVPCWPFFI